MIVEDATALNDAGQNVNFLQNFLPSLNELNLLSS